MLGQETLRERISARAGPHFLRHASRTQRTDRTEVANYRTKVRYGKALVKFSGTWENEFLNSSLT
jgi:hypothetical protein